MARSNSLGEQALALAHESIGGYYELVSRGPAHSQFSELKDTEEYARLQSAAEVFLRDNVDNLYDITEADYPKSVKAASKAFGRLAAAGAIETAKRTVYAADRQQKMADLLLDRRVTATILGGHSFLVDRSGKYLPDVSLGTEITRDFRNFEPMTARLKLMPDDGENIFGIGVPLWAFDRPDNKGNMTFRQLAELAVH